MLINGTNITGLFKYNPDFTYEQGDLVIKNEILYSCLKTATGKDPETEKEYFTLYPGNKIDSAAEYFENPEGTGLISSKALTEILQVFSYGLDNSGIIKEEITYDPNTDLYSYDSLDTIIKRSDVNTGIFKVSNNLPEVRNLLLYASTQSTDSSFVVVRQFTYEDGNDIFRIQCLLDPENKKLYFRYAKGSVEEQEIVYSQVSKWYSVFADDTKTTQDYLNEIQSYYTAKLNYYESAFRSYKNKFCFSNIRFTQSGQRVTINFEDLGIEELPQDCFLITAIIKTPVSENLYKNHSVIIDIADPGDLYLSSLLHITVSSGEDCIYIDLPENSFIKDVYFRNYVDSDVMPVLVYYAPEVATGNYSSVTTNSAVCSGTVIKTGGESAFAGGGANANIIMRGICYSHELRNPRIDNGGIIETAATNSLGTFEVTLNGLRSSRSYNYCAFAKNDKDSTVSYGITNYFTTQEELPVPRITVINLTSTATTITVRYSISNASVQNTGVYYSDDSWATQHTVYYTGGDRSTDNGDSNKSEQNSTRGSSNISGGNDIIDSGSEINKVGGDYIVTIRNLKSGTAYSLKVFAISTDNVEGTSGEQKISTSSDNYLTVRTISAESYTSSSITVSGEILTNDGSEIIEKGAWYLTGKYSEPSSSTGTCIRSNDEGNSFTVEITGLEPSTAYYVCAYAKNANGVFAYEGVRSVNTNSSSTSPTVALNGRLTTSTDSITGKVRVTYNGGSQINKLGLWCGTTNSEPSSSDSNIVWENYSGLSSSVIEMEITKTGLDSGTTYYVKGVALNSDGGFGYSATTQATTKEEQVLTPDVNLVSVNNNSPKTANVSITYSSNDFSITERGILYSTNSSNITYGASGVTAVVDSTYNSSNIKSESFNVKVSNMNSTTYYFRGYVKSGQTYYYSNISSATTIYPSIDLSVTDTGFTNNNGSVKIFLKGTINNYSTISSILSGQVGFRWGTSSNNLSEIIPVTLDTSNRGDSINFTGTLQSSRTGTFYIKSFVEDKNSIVYLSNVHSRSITSSGE